MISLLPNTPSQDVYLTLREKAKDLPLYTHYLVIFTNMTSRVEYAFVANVVTDNDRYTKIAINTDTNAPTNGDVLIEETGQFWYNVWGQNSSSNLDPLNASVVGEIERGTLQVITQETFYNPNAVTIPDNIIYYQ
jgi:hypothetical protein